MKTPSSLRIGIDCINVHMTGGRERVACRIANHMAGKGHKVIIFCGSPFHAKPAYPLDPRVAVVFVDINDSHASIASLRKTLQSLDLDVLAVLETFKEHLLWAVALLGTGIPYIYSEHGSPDLAERKWSRKGRLAAMSGADSIRLMHEEYLDSLPAFLRDRAVVIPNSVPEIPRGMGQVRTTTPPYILGSLGRIAPEKQIFLLIKAFETLQPEFPDWELHIWGPDNEEDHRTMGLIESSPVNRAIFMHGPTQDVLGAFSKMHVYCTPSREEGVPNAVLEALTCGTPVVGFADCPGVNLLVEHERNGLLAHQMTAKALTDSLRRIMGDPSLRASMGKQAVTVREKFPPDIFLQQWEQLILKTAEYKGHTQLDSFADEEFSAQATLSAAARREWLYTDFGKTKPITLRRNRNYLDREIFAVRESLSQSALSKADETFSLAVCILFHEKLDQTKECIESFLPSGVPIHILDNGSSERNSQALLNFCASFSQVNVRRVAANLGAAAGRNFLWRTVRADWLFYVDSDIVIQPGTWRMAAKHYIKKLGHEVHVLQPALYNLFLRSGTSIGRSFFSLHSGKRHLAPPALELTNYFPGGAVLIKRSMLEDLGGYNEEMVSSCEDVELCVRAARQGYDIRVVSIPEIKLFHEHLPALTIEDQEAARARYDIEQVKHSAALIKRLHRVNWDHNIKREDERRNEMFSSDTSPALAPIAPESGIFLLEQDPEDPPSRNAAESGIAVLARVVAAYPDLRDITIRCRSNVPVETLNSVLQFLHTKGIAASGEFHTPLPHGVVLSGLQRVSFVLDDVAAGDMPELAPYRDALESMRAASIRCGFQLSVRKDRLDTLAAIIAQCDEIKPEFLLLLPYTPGKTATAEELERIVDSRDKAGKKLLLTLCAGRSYCAPPFFPDLAANNHTCDAYLTLISFDATGNLGGCPVQNPAASALNILSHPDPYNHPTMQRYRNRAIHGCSPHPACQFCPQRAVKSHIYREPTPDEIREVVESGAFDEDYYRRLYLLGRAEQIPPVVHFLRFGVHKEYKPNTRFNPRWYLSAFPEAAQGDLNPLFHYIRKGRYLGYPSNEGDLSEVNIQHEKKRCSLTAAGRIAHVRNFVPGNIKGDELAITPDEAVLWKNEARLRFSGGSQQSRDDGGREFAFPGLLKSALDRILDIHCGPEQHSSGDLFRGKFLCNKIRYDILSGLEEDVTVSQARFGSAPYAVVTLLDTIEFLPDPVGTILAGLASLEYGGAIAIQSFENVSEYANYENLYRCNVTIVGGRPVLWTGQASLDLEHLLKGAARVDAMRFVGSHHERNRIKIIVRKTVDLDA